MMVSILTTSIVLYILSVFGFFVVPGGKINLASTIPSWMKSKLQTVGSHQVLAALTDADWGLPSGEKL